jgi:pentatricopeptide repeat domain-containing protein 3
MDMNLLGVRPNLTTFNNVLYSLARIANYREARGLALRTLNEMRAVGIEPSLASWSHVLLIYYPGDQSESNILNAIVDYLEGEVSVKMWIF